MIKQKSNWASFLSGKKKKGDIIVLGGGGGGGHGGGHHYSQVLVNYFTLTEEWTKTFILFFSLISFRTQCITAAEVTEEEEEEVMVITTVDMMTTISFGARRWAVQSGLVRLLLLCFWVFTKLLLHLSTYFIQLITYNNHNHPSTYSQTILPTHKKVASLSPQKLNFFIVLKCDIFFTQNVVHFPSAYFLFPIFKLPTFHFLLLCLFFCRP